MELIGRIRREPFLKGKTIKEIARDLKVSRNTVRKVLRSGETLIKPVACTPAADWEKGQVEIQVGLAREPFFTPRLRPTIQEL